MNAATLPEHGTWQRYANKRAGCRCIPCRAGWRDYNRTRNRAIAYGRLVPEPLVDATPARERLAELRAWGVGARALAETHDVSRVTLERIANGQQRRIRACTHAAVMALRPDPALLMDRAKVDGTGARRRIQALVAQGWTMSALATRMGCTAENVRQIATGRNGHYVTAGTWRAVSALYASTWSIPAPSGSAAQRGASKAARAMAARRGWPVALAWDDDSIDDPAAVPNLGESNHLPNGGGGRPAVEVAEDVQFLLDNDATLTTKGAAHRLGMLPDSLKTSLARAGRLDLRDRLTHNAQEAA